MLLTHSNRSRTLLAVLAILITVALASAPMAFARRPVSPFGMTSHVLGDYTTAQVRRELDLVAKAGGSWIRVDIPWRFVEPADGEYSSHTLGQIDYILAAAAKRGIKIEAVIVEIPDWANSGRGMWVPPNDDAKFERFMRFMATRYAGRITYWELGNEVNETEFWAVPRDSSAARYVHFLQYGYRGVKSGNPQAQVISAGLAGSDYDYLQELYAAGARGYFDILGVHPYTNGRSPWVVDLMEPGSTFAGLAFMKTTMERNGEVGKRIWITEFGWQTSRVGHHVTPRQQADYTYGAYRRFFKELPYVEMMFAYSARDAGKNPYSSTQNYGLLRRDYSAKPAYSAFRRAFDAFQAVPTRLAIRSSRKSIRRGDKVVVSGKLATVAGVPVSLQRRVGTRWVTVRRIRTSSSGAYSTKVRLSSRGTKRFRTVFVGDRVKRSARSRTISIGVR